MVRCPRASSVATTIYYNEGGKQIAAPRSTTIRYRPDLARNVDNLQAIEDAEWSDAQFTMRACHTVTD